MSFLYNGIIGYRTFSVKNSSSGRVFDALLREGVPFSVKNSDGINTVYIIPSHSARRHKKAMSRLKAESDGRPCGIPHFIFRYRLRTGMFIGAILAVIITVFSSFFVWDINISGNDSLSDEYILSLLEEYGFYVGCRIPGTDNVKISRAAVLAEEKLSHMSINLRGTVANVEIREARTEEKRIGTEPSNLVALYDGQIVSATVTGGVCAVKKGDIVSKGDMLVGGVIESSALGYHLTRSSGVILAKIEAEKEAVIPYVIKEKVYTGREYTEKSVKFFSGEINLFIKHRLLYDNYDIIKNTKRVCLFGRIELPIFIYSTVYSEYTDTERTLAYSEAVSLAERKISKEFSALTEVSEVLSYDTEITESENVVTVKKRLVCITDIAEEIKIMIK